MLGVDSGHIKQPFPGFVLIATCVNDLTYPMVDVLKTHNWLQHFQIYVGQELVQGKHKGKGQKKYILNFYKSF